MFKKILVPIDVSQSDSGEASLKVAAGLAGKTGAKLMLLNVIGDIPNLVANQLPSNYTETMEKSSAEALDEVASRNGLASGSYEVQTSHGQIYHEIIEAAEKGGADLIVIASHQPDVSDYLLGSTAGKVVRHAHCSVLVVRG
jgi:nucleotide-binding universal stress UspA family protein